MIALLRSRRQSVAGMGGSMPFADAGGLMDQAAIMLDAFDVMDGAVNELEAEDRERRDAKTKGRDPRRPEANP